MNCVGREDRRASKADVAAATSPKARRPQQLDVDADPAAMLTFVRFRVVLTRNRIKRSLRLKRGSGFIAVALITLVLIIIVVITMVMVPMVLTSATVESGGAATFGVIELLAIVTASRKKRVFDGIHASRDLVKQRKQGR